MCGCASCTANAETIKRQDVVLMSASGPLREVHRYLSRDGTTVIALATAGQSDSEVISLVKAQAP
jgi:hypothetical protein